MSAFSFEARRLGSGSRINVDYACLKQVIKQKPNGGKVLPLGSDTAWVALLLGGALATGQNDMV